MVRPPMRYIDDICSFISDIIEPALFISVDDYDSIAVLESAIFPFFLFRLFNF